MFLRHFLIISEFPLGCVSFEGPHTVDCLNAVWIAAGCLEDGSGFPGNVDFEENDTLLNTNLK